MKKFISIILILGCLSLPVIGLCAGYKASGPHGSSVIVSRQGGLFFGILVTTDGTNDVTVNVYDSNESTGSGQMLIGPDFLVQGAAYFGGFTLFENPIHVSDGIYISISGTNAHVIVYYQ